MAGRQDFFDGPTHHFPGCISEELFGALIPAGDDAFVALPDDRILGRLNNGSQAISRLVQMPALRHIAIGNDDLTGFAAGGGTDLPRARFAIGLAPKKKFEILDELATQSPHGGPLGRRQGFAVDRKSVELVDHLAIVRMFGKGEQALRRFVDENGLALTIQDQDTLGHVVEDRLQPQLAGGQPLRLLGESPVDDRGRKDDAEDEQSYHGDADEAESRYIDGMGQRRVHERQGDELHRHHANVVHDWNGQTHHQPAHDSAPARSGEPFPEGKGEMKSGKGYADRQQNRKSNQPWRIHAHGGQAHGFHADVMHGGDAASHEDPTDDHSSGSHRGTADGKERNR